jgi:hypothetical protein
MNISLRHNFVFPKLNHDIITRVLEEMLMKNFAGSISRRAIGQRADRRGLRIQGITAIADNDLEYIHFISNRYLEFARRAT